MARKLIFGNDIVGFTTSTGTITVKGYIPSSKLLLVNNVTKNTSIYNFSDPTTLTTNTYNPDTDTTVIDLSYDTTSMSSTDKLQIYYEEENVEIQPSQSLIDPVSKLRVSNPENLIDTDFEYSLQPSKWESVRLVNNIPTFYTKSDPGSGIKVDNVTTTINSNSINVSTSIAHNLIEGSVFEISNLTDVLYEGSFIVDKISSSNSFTYKVSFNSTSSNTISTPYSEIYSGAFYSGSAVQLTDITTDAGEDSKLSVTLPNNHGFNEKTKFYLKKSGGLQAYPFTSADVVGSGLTTYKSTITTSNINTTDSSVYYENTRIVFDDFIGDFEVNFSASDLNVTTGSITYNVASQVGPSNTTPLAVGDSLVFYTPLGNTLPTNYTQFKPLYVFESNYDSNTGICTIRVASTHGSSTPFAPGVSGGAGTNTFGNHRLIRGQRVLNSNSRHRVDFFGNHGLRRGDRVIATWFSNSLGWGTIPTSLVNPSNYTLFTADSILSATRVDFSGNQNTSRNYNTSQFLVLCKVKENPKANSIYLSADEGFIQSTFPSGVPVVYTTGGTAITGLTAGATYIISPINTVTGLTTDAWYRIYSTAGFDGVNIPTTPINFTCTSPTVGNILNSTQSFAYTTLRDDAHTIKLNSPIISNFEKVQYTTAGTTIGNLTPNTTYKVKKNDRNLDDTYHRLSDAIGIGSDANQVSFFSLVHAANANTFTLNITLGTNLLNCGITTGGYVQINGVTGSSFIENLFNGVFEVVSYGLTNRNRQIGLNLQTKPGSLLNNSQSLSGSNVANASVTGIVTFTNVGSGNHNFIVNRDGIVDGVYEASNITDTSFEFVGIGASLPVVTKSIIGGVPQGSVGVGTNWLKIVGHRFADGVELEYSTSGSPIDPLVSGQTYYVRVLDNDYIALSNTSAEAINRPNGIYSDDQTPGTIIFTSAGDAVSHSFFTNSIKSFVPGAGKIGFTSTSNIITGVSADENGNTAKFLTDFNAGDTIKIYSNTTNVGPGTYFESRITKINSNTVMRIQDVPPYPTTGVGFTDANYFVPTRLYPISDSKISHRPFDGGVNLYAGLIPNTQAIRQTRKYFRYQSGKGIQLSMAVNFNPTFDIDTISIDGEVGITSSIIVKSKFPHGISTSIVVDDTEQNIKFVDVISPVGYNTSFTVSEVVDDFRFKVNFPTAAPSETPKGFAKFVVNNWQDSNVKAGLFDDQNGFFFKYDGNKLYAVRRSSTQQLSGKISVNQGSNTVSGTDTRFISQAQLTIDDKIVIRGQVYKVTNIPSDDVFEIQPAYRGQDTNNCVISKVIDTEVPQEEWSLDRCDGTGYTGYYLDINTIQMIYMDYSWYGAGKIRFGFKDQRGEVKYVHEFKHNNKFRESYLRSGNLPARYEVETGKNPLFSPSLFHWGASIIMDGRFDDDKSYLFTADSDSLPFTNGGLANNGSGQRPRGRYALNSNRVTGIDRTEASSVAVGEVITNSALPADFPTGTTITSIEIDQTDDTSRSANRYALVLSNNALVGRTSDQTFNIFSGTSEQLRSYIPLVSIRLAPSVDNGTTGLLGIRDIINHMQLTLKSAGVLVTHDCEVALYINSNLSDDKFTPFGAPSLAQLYKHSVGDTFEGGTKIYSFRAQGGSVVSSTTGKRGLNVTSVSLDELALLGNSILGGDNTFPDGPDILTIAIKPVDTSQITGSSPLIASARITWSESQA